MSSTACVAYFGLRFPMEAHEIDRLEEGRDARQIAAKRAGLTSYWGNFGGDADRYVLLVGARIAVLGVENEAARTWPADGLLSLMDDTGRRLRSVDLCEEPGLHLEWMTDV